MGGVHQYLSQSDLQVLNVLLELVALRLQLAFGSADVSIGVLLLLQTSLQLLETGEKKGGDG